MASPSKRGRKRGACYACWVNAPKTPNHAERCRALTRDARVGTLSTIARDPAGYPFGSLVTVAFDRAGRPLLLLSRLAEHTQNLIHRSDASLLVTEALDPKATAEALTLGRATILGPCRAVADAERAEVGATFLAAHPDAARYAEFADFAFYRLEPVALRYVGGFGQMSWVSPDDYARAGFAQG